MSKRTHVGVVVMVLTLLLTGCFRQASPEIVPTVESVTPTGLPVTPTRQGGSGFVTPFATGQGPDMTRMPTLGSPAPTLPLVIPGTPSPTSAGAMPGAPLSSTAAGPAAARTVPFVAGPTFTPAAGAPPINLNPQLPTPTGGPVNPVAGSSVSGEDCVYVVQPGDNAFHIATIYGMTLDELVAYNNLDNADYLFEGQELKIPACGRADSETSEITPPASTGGETQAQPTSAPVINAAGQTVHVVQGGENLFRIALRYGVTMQAIVDANGLGSQDAILSIGQQLIIPSP